MSNIRLLRLVFFATLLTAGLLALLFECSLLPSGQLAGNEQAGYWMGIAGVALTLICVPLALKLLKFTRVREAVVRSETAYTRWCLLRICLLYTPLLFNTLGYYLLGFEPTFSYMVLMVIVALVFVWPSRDRMVYERELNYSQEEQ